MSSQKIVLMRKYHTVSMNTFGITTDHLVLTFSYDINNKVFFYINLQLICLTHIVNFPKV